MKKQDITPKIINLAKRIAKYWRMEIYRGCWIKIGGEAQLITSTCDDYFFTGCNCFKNRWTNRKGSGVPVPSISDVLLKLDELNMIIYNLGQWEQGIDHRDLSDAWIVVIRKRYRDKSSEVEIKAPSLHEALLAALLEVLEKEE